MTGSAAITGDEYVSSAVRRLLLQGSLYDPLTRRLLVDAGLSPGMRVLDVGSGAGNVSTIAGNLVAPRGSVLGVDADAAMVAFARAQVGQSANVNILSGNVDQVDPEGPIDAVVGRFVLRELADPVATLRRLARKLAASGAGGVVAFQEKILAIPITSIPPVPLLDRVHTWMSETRRIAGVRTDTGARITDIFREAGLALCEMRLESPLGGGAGWPGYAYLAESLRRMLPLAAAFGITTTEEVGIDTLAARLETAAADATVILTPCVGAWARLPS